MRSRTFPAGFSATLRARFAPLKNSRQELEREDQGPRTTRVVLPLNRKGRPCEVVGV
jgi:hypothetical protein